MTVAASDLVSGKRRLPIPYSWATMTTKSRADALFGLMAALVSATCVRETPAAVMPRALEAAGD